MNLKLRNLRILISKQTTQHLIALYTTRIPFTNVCLIGQLTNSFIDATITDCINEVPFAIGALSSRTKNRNLIRVNQA